MQPCPSRLKAFPLDGDDEDLADLALDLYDNAVISTSKDPMSMRLRLLYQVVINDDDGSIDLSFNESALRVAEQPGHEYHDAIRLLVQRSEKKA